MAIVEIIDRKGIMIEEKETTEIMIEETTMENTKIIIKSS
jgi:hypothetical protein